MNEIWYMYTFNRKHHYKAYTEDRVCMEKLRAMQEVKRMGEYTSIKDKKYYAEDYVFPKNKYNVVSKALGLPRQKVKRDFLITAS